jgi:hypothetical protein
MTAGVKRPALSPENEKKPGTSRRPGFLDIP